MSEVPDIDGNLYHVQFRLHDNRFVNSPMAIRAGSGYLRSDILSLGEPAYDPVRRMLSIGLGDTQGFSIMATDRAANLISEYTPLTDGAGCYLNYNSIYYANNKLLEVSYNVVKFMTSLTISSSSDVNSYIIRLGYQHMYDMVGLLNNIQQALHHLMSGDLNEAEIDNLFVIKNTTDPAKLDPSFPEVYGQQRNLLTWSEDLSTNVGLVNSTVTVNTTIAPDNTLSMDTLVGTISTATADTCYVGKTATVVANSKYCASAIFKKGTSPKSTLLLSFFGGTHAFEDAVITMDWTTLIATLVSSNSSWQGGLIVMGNGYYRLWVSGPAYDNTSALLRVYVRDQTTSHVTGETTIVWGAMINKGFVPMGYNKTTASL